MHNPPAEGNFCDENGNVQKPAIVEDCNRRTGYVDKETEWQIVTLLAAAYGIGKTKLFFHLLVLTILNSYILFCSCGKKRPLIENFACKGQANTCGKRITTAKNTWKTSKCCHPSRQIGYK
jgi:hypothetical protein